MERLLRIVCFLTAVSATLGESTQSFKDAVAPLARGCIDSVAATEEDYETVVHREPLETTTAKCLLACVYEKLGVFTADGDIVSGDALMPIMDKVYSFREFQTIMRTQVVQDCINQVNGSHEDKCELVKHFLDCVRKHY